MFQVDRLEERSLLVAPTVSGVALLGPSRAISGFSAAFTADMSLPQVRDPHNYKLEGLRNGHFVTIPLAGASYDSAHHVVQVSTASPFSQTSFRQIRVTFVGKGPGGLTDSSGAALDSRRPDGPGRNEVHAFNVLSGVRIRYRDRDGDLVTFKTTGGGHLDLLQNVRGDAEQAWIVDPVSSKTNLVATVQANGKSGGSTTLGELVGTDDSKVSAIELDHEGVHVSHTTITSVAHGIIAILIGL